MCVYSGDVCSVGVGVVVVACVVVCVRVYSGDVYTAHIVYHYISVVVGCVCVCVCVCVVCMMVLLLLSRFSRVQLGATP